MVCFVCGGLLLSFVPTIHPPHLPIPTGNDLDESITPVEAGLTWTIAKSRRDKCDFLGGEVCETFWGMVQDHVGFSGCMWIHTDTAGCICSFCSQVYVDHFTYEEEFNSLYTVCDVEQHR